jgi:RNA polymerase sigma factor (sigma-70 family)
MISGCASRLDFKDKISPHLEILLQFSFWLTKNGRDATRLMREVIAEANQSWDEPMPDEACRIWLHRILTRQFIDSLQQKWRPSASISGDPVGENLVNNDLLAETPVTSARQESFSARESDDEVGYFRAMASLPAVYRSAMILAHLEGFSNWEIANLAGAQPKAVESWLNRGSGCLREELSAHLLDSDRLLSVSDRAD